jgi:acyl-CoA reductase-like NAD-dependent aldehyde dehydrogenase
MVYRNLIAGAWADASASIRNINPSNLDDVVGEYADASAEQARQAAAAAAQAFPAWSRSGIQARADALDRIGAEILARREEIGRLLSREEGKTLPEGIGEAARAGNIFKFFAGEALRIAGEDLASVRPGVRVRILRQPVGVVGIVTPWNFPIAIPAWKIAPALAFGNCIVFKPAQLTPGCAWVLAEIIARSGVPPGVFNLVMGRGSVVGEAIAESPHVDAISFTGSVETGAGILARATLRSPHAKVQLEMGGKNPLVVLDDADLETAVSCAVNGAYFSTGQRCTASSRLIVSEGIADTFVAALHDRLPKLDVNDALRAGTDIGPVVDEKQLEQDLRYIELARREGARLVTGGEIVHRDTRGYYLTPALFVDTTNAMTINRDEVFGPVACVVRVAGYEEALSVANDTQFGLVAGICTASLKFASHFQEHAQAGMVMVNLPTAGVDYHVPFGGSKASSFGPKEQGGSARDFYTALKVCYVSA